MRRYLNWKTSLGIAALLIVAASLYYTSQLAGKLAGEERKKVELVVSAISAITNEKNSGETGFELKILDENTTVPLIIADKNDVIQFSKNIAIPATQDSITYLKEQLQEFKEQHGALEAYYGVGQKNNIYYGESSLLRQLRFFPYVQMTIILLFLAVIIIAITVAQRSLQNQVWAGLSKETAHQLGTPLSSITGWLELLRENEENHDAVSEMEKDLARLQLVADRFSKVGSIPQLQEEDLVPRMEAMVEYMQRRAPSRVAISLQTNEPHIPVNISAALFDWVIENLIRNALDAMDGKGTIALIITNLPQQVLLDVCDNGKGIPKHQIKKVFNPGFTTKKRGWGLGLSLAKRIVEQFHHGSLFVKQSEVGKGTTFRIILRR